MVNERLSSLISAGLTAGLGIAFVLGASGLELGTARAMGPGYFPTMVGYLMIGTGVLMAVFDRSAIAEAPDVKPFVFIALAILAFALLVGRFGFVPALFVSITIAAAADRQFNVFHALITGALLSVATWLIFVMGLGIRMTPFALPW